MTAIADDRNLLILLKTVKLFCPLKHLGCEEILSYESFKEHLTECGECRFCNNNNIIQNKKNSHLLEDCSDLIIKC